MKKKSKSKIGGSCGCNKLKGGCSNCGLLGGCDCTKNQNGGGISLNEISVPFLLLAAKIGVQKLNKKGGGKSKKFKNTRRRDIF